MEVSPNIANDVDAPRREGTATVAAQAAPHVRASGARDAGSELPTQAGLSLLAIQLNPC